MKKYDFDDLTASLRSSGLDITEKSIPARGGTIKLFYIAQLTDRASLSENVVKPLILHCSGGKVIPTAQSTVDGIIYADGCEIESDPERVLEYVLAGMVVILFSIDANYIVINLKKVEKRSVSTPSLSYTIRGPQDCFTENLDTNLSLLRYRIKDKNLRIKYFDVGVRSKTRVAVIYIQDIANDIVVSEVQKRIQDIDADGIGESGELQSFLLNHQMKLFPQMGLIERSDMAYHTLLQGKVLVLTEGSGIGIAAPKTFSEFFYSCDDRYDNKYFGAIARLLRYLAIALGLTASSLFVAITSFHTDVLPSDYLIALAQMRVNVPFNALVGALLLEFIMELVREALLRVPKQIGPAIGIVSGIVIGQASISAGFFSPVLLTLAAISLLSSFAIPDYTLMNSFRILKFVLILMTGAFGFFGFTVCLTFIAIELVSLNSFGTPYFAPWVPFNLRDFSKTLIDRSDVDTQRPEYLNPKDKVRMKKRPNE